MVAISVFFFQAEDGIRDDLVTGVQTCALPISHFAPPLSIARISSRYCHPTKATVVTDRKSTRLHSSHQIISDAAFCLRKRRPPARWERHGPHPCREPPHRRTPEGLRRRREGPG